jgi:predicted  nucleic acid-binding Zn ribbon protein
MEDIYIRSVRFPIAVDLKFEKIARKLGRSKRQLFSEMVDYFYKSKKDPTDLNDELLKNTLLKNHQQYIAFIRAQENLLLIPIKSEITRISGSQRDIVQLFDNDVKKANELLMKAQSRQTDMLQQLSNKVDLLQRKELSMKEIKVQFLSILKDYVKARDGLGLMSTLRDREELLKQAIRALEAL